MPRLTDTFTNTPEDAARFEELYNAGEPVAFEWSEEWPDVGGWRFFDPALLAALVEDCTPAPCECGATCDDCHPF